MTVAAPKNFTHGDLVRWRRVGGLVLGEVEYEPGQRIPRHVHPHARFVLVLKGALTEIRGEEGHGGLGLRALTLYAAFVAVTAACIALPTSLVETVKIRWSVYPATSLVSLLCVSRA